MGGTYYSFDTDGSFYGSMGVGRRDDPFFKRVNSHGKETYFVEADLLVCTRPGTPNLIQVCRRLGKKVE